MLAEGVLATLRRKQQGETEGKLLSRKPSTVCFIWLDILGPTFDSASVTALSELQLFGFFFGGGFFIVVICFGRAVA